MIHRISATPECARTDMFAGVKLDGGAGHRPAKYCRMLAINCSCSKHFRIFSIICTCRLSVQPHCHWPAREQVSLAFGLRLGQVVLEGATGAPSRTTTMSVSSAEGMRWTLRPGTGERAGSRTSVLLLAVCLLGIAGGAVWFYSASQRSSAGTTGQTSGTPASLLSDSTRAVLGRLESPLE